MVPDAQLFTILSQHQESLVDRLVLRIHDSVPGYARMEGSALRASVGLLVEAMLDALQRGENAALSEKILRTSRERVDMGFSTAEFLRAIFLLLPVSRELIREVGPRNDPSFARAFTALEDRLHEMAAMSANIYAETSAQQLRAKNQELNRLNQELQAREKALREQGHQVERALASANEFNQRVIESLASGVIVVDSNSLEITLFSQRAEAITDLSAEQVLGKPAVEALAPLGGVDHELMLRTVRATGRFPLTKMTVTSAKGRKRTMFVRAQRMYGAEGEVEGTVVVFDDVSERELLIDSFSRYVSRDLVTRLLARAEPLGLEGEKRTCTVLFADIRGFTSLAERMQPEALHRLLNAYLHVMIESIVDRGGFIDKFVGDKVMALFTGPRQASESAAAAVEAAGEIHRRIAQLNAERAKLGEPAIEVGVGVNTGPVVVGNVGDEARMDFTAIGDAVNVADRLQSLAAGDQTLVGGATAELVQPLFGLRDLGLKSVKGRAAPVPVFEVLGPAERGP